MIYNSFIKKRNKNYLIYFFVLIFIAILGRIISSNIFSLIYGLDEVLSMLLEFLHPDFSQAGDVFAKLWETISMAIIGTFLGVSTSIIFSFLTAENLKVFKPLRRFLNGVLSIMRTIPSLIWAGIFVTLFSIGKFSGFLALYLIATLMSTKLVKEYIESIKQNQLDGLLACGASKIKILFNGVIPRIKGLFISVFFLCLETNIRSATILGMVGAGGIGIILWRDLNFMKYRRVSFIILILILTIYLIDILSYVVRKRIKYNNKYNDYDKWKKKKVLSLIFFSILFIIFIYLAVTKVSIGWDRFLLGVESFKVMMGRMLSPDFSYLPKGLLALLESMSMALYATFFGVLIGLVFAYFAASNFHKNKIFTKIFKLFLNFLRTIPPVIFAVFYFRAVGPGAYSGTLALLTYTAGTFAKMFYERIEEIGEEEKNKLISCGANGIKNYIFNIIPSRFSDVMSMALYRMESNIRNSSIVGMIGAGGIGKLLNMQITWRNWERTGVLLFLVAISTILIDIISRRIRKNLVK